MTDDTYTGEFIRDLDIVHDILQDATSRVYHEWEIDLVKGKIETLGTLIQSTNERPVLQFTLRQIRLLWEMCTAQDVDVLNDNLNKVGATEDADLAQEVEALGDMLDPQGLFLQEWLNLNAKQ